MRLLGDSNVVDRLVSVANLPVFAVSAIRGKPCSSDIINQLCYAAQEALKAGRNKVDRCWHPSTLHFNQIYSHNYKVQFCPRLLV
jgi:hypothetical protein